MALCVRSDFRQSLAVLMQCSEQVLPSDDADDLVGFDYRDAVDVTLLVSQNCKNVIEVVIRGDGDDVANHHRADRLVGVLRQIDSHIKIIPRKIKCVIDRFDERGKPDRDLERAITRLEQINEIALCDDPN